jgi:hypothetical protein
MVAILPEALLLASPAEVDPLSRLWRLPTELAVGDAMPTEAGDLSGCCCCHDLDEDVR